jgi:hypothetical protein
VLRGRSVNTLWDRAAESDLGKHFLVWLRPFHNEPAREALLHRFSNVVDRTLKIPSPLDRRITTHRPVLLTGIASAGNQLRLTGIDRHLISSATRALRQYRATRGVGRAVLTLTRKAQLARVLASGTVFRIDPVVPLNLTSVVLPPKVH